jgi:hypothetical protein
MDLLDAMCALSGRPSPPSGPHPLRRVYGHVLQGAGSLPLGVLQPGDVSAATQVREGLLNVEVPPASDAAALCIRRIVDELGAPDLWELARGTAMTRDELAWGAAVTLAMGCSMQRDLLDELAAQLLVDEIAERPPQHWGRHHAGAVRAALYRCLADLADALLEVSESTPTPLDWTVDDNGGMRTSVVIGGVARGVLVQGVESGPSAAEPLWHHPSLRATPTTWQWRIESGSADRASHGCGPFPSALAARHAAECAITALAARRCGS